MIEAKSNMGYVEVQLSGSVPMLCADTTQIVRSIYRKIAERNYESEEEYKKMITADLCRLAFKKDCENENPKLDDNILKALKELIKLIEE